MKADLNIFDDARTGGPAYPAMEVRAVDTGDIVANADQGLTKLDLFAIHVDGRLSKETAMTLMNVTKVPTDPIESIQFWAAAEAKLRYVKAAAMMDARQP